MREGRVCGEVGSVLVWRGEVGMVQSRHTHLQ